MNLFFLFSDARVRNKNINSNLFHCILFSYIKKKLCTCKNKFILFVYSLMSESGIKNTDLNLFRFYSYAIFINVRVGSIRS